MLAMKTPPSLQKSLDATKVDYVKLGKSGLRVSFPILGAMGLGDSSMAPWVLGEDESLAVLKEAYDNGINTWDTANTYSNGLSEAVIGKAIQKFDIPRHKLVIMTKCALFVGEEPDVIGVAYPDQLLQSKDYSNAGGA